MLGSVKPLSIIVLPVLFEGQVKAVIELASIRQFSPVNLSLLAALRNPVAAGNAERKLRNELKTQANGAAITMRSDCDGARKSTIGSMSMSLTGGKPTWILADFRRFLSNGDWFHSPHYGTVHDTYLRQFRDSGDLPSLRGDATVIS